jgi:hypothetical protein
MGGQHQGFQSLHRPRRTIAVALGLQSNMTKPCK